MTQAQVDWVARAASLQKPRNMLIGGRKVAALSGETYQVLSPRDGRAIAELPQGSSQDVDRAVAAARLSFERGVWANMPPKERKKKLVSLAGLLERNRESLGLMDTLCMGAPISLTVTHCVQWAIDCFQWYGEALDKIYDEVAPTGNSTLAMITREPVGVVGAVLPWNWPCGTLGWKVPPALAAGNSVVLKPDEQTSLSALRIAELALEAGIPEGVFNVVTGGAPAGEALGRHMDVDVVAFTGSTQVGKAFLKYSGESNMKAVWLECGGKSPNIVFADAPDLAVAARAAAAAIFMNTGQVCAAGSRLIVENSVRQEFLHALVDAAKQFAPGDPLHPDTLMGPIAKAAQLERVMSYIELGSNEGARLITGGKRVNARTGGYYIEPTVFEGVESTMRIAQEEIFGPVLAVIGFDTVEQAIEAANNTTYGLASALWTRDLSKAHRVARAIRAGTVNVNCYGAEASEVVVPFGGYKQSGVGRDKSLHALDKYMQLKTTWIAL